MVEVIILMMKKKESIFLITMKISLILANIYLIFMKK